MGCDIHLYREKFVDGKWVSADEWENDDGYVYVPYEKRAYKGRNYQLFGFLSKGVRVDNDYAFEPRGIPADASIEVYQQNELWSSDGHSHSYLYLHELKSAISFLNEKKLKISGMKDKHQLEKFNESIASDSPDYDLIFPYCKWANSENYVEFEAEIPCLFYFGDELKKIVESFNDIDGENHRIVFFFDN